MQLADSQSAGGERTTALGGQVDGLTEQMGGLGDQLGLLTERTDGLTGEIGALGERLGATETRLEAAAATDQRAAALALITAQLGTAVGQAQPFEDLLANLKSLGGDDQVVAAAHEQLAPSAGGGVPSLASLRAALAADAAEIVHEARAPEGEGMLDKAAGNLLRLVSVRPVGAEVEGDSAAARVARAEAHMAEADLAAAVAEIEQVEGPAATTAAPWLADAKRRIDAEVAVASLRQHATALLSQAP
jgi:hypothetical protein